MMTVHELLSRIDAYQQKSGYKDSTVSLRVFNDGQRLAVLRRRPRMWPQTIDKAIARLETLEEKLPEGEAAA